ncbi:MAG: S8 family serine peptidase [Corynebacterium sp.]|uniref:S8 family serine peptidase n=1 Tax=Corynebacterium sp. TaxID=1720 RepID=UPI0026DFCAE5|nr:S8 family serine peptidase [Corynebacterium sp.]MDO5669870.1 S8 family serine peptidase [Corynebacterium sp.]
MVGTLAASTLSSPSTAQEAQPPGEDIIATDDLVDREQTTDLTPTNRFLVSYHPGTMNTSEDREGVVTQALEDIGAEESSATELRETATGAAVIESAQELTPEQSDEVLDRLNADPAVEYAEIDAILSILDRPNDPHFPRQWPLTGTAGIDILPAWDISRGEGQTVAVIDTGITAHPDLNDNLLPGYDFISDSSRARDGDGRDNDPRDEGDWHTAGECGTNRAANSSWHGTHVAGTIAAVTGNGEGIAGVAPRAGIVPIRALGMCGGYLSDITDSVIWAAGGSVPQAPANAHPADVINMSLGGSGQCSPTYQRAIDLAVSRNATVVVAAGNENRDASQVQPANCNNTITVGAVGDSGQRASYSNYGSTVDVWAPGGDQSRGAGVLSTINTGRTTPSQPSYGEYQGTSMAAPHVAGVAALIGAAVPGANTSEVSQRIMDSTGNGTIVKAPRALQGATPPNPEPEPENPGAPEAPEDPAEINAALLQATNQARSRAGVPPLQARPELGSLAQDWAETMSRDNRLYHRPDLRRHSNNEYTVSENILYMRGGTITAESIVQVWMNSPQHRANLLNPRHRWLGVGVAESADGTTYAVQNFGTPRISR